VDQLILVEGEGEVNFFNGNYTDYRIALENKEKQPEVKVVKDSSASTAVESTSTNAPAKKLSFKEQKEFEDLEKEMAKLEAEKETLIEKLNAGSENFQELANWSKAIEDIKNTLEEKELRWLELSM
jgi:ATP-binding cassette subfamily F protein uup